MALWDQWVEAALSKLASRSLLRSTRPISLSPTPSIDGLETFDGPRHFDRSSVEVDMDECTFSQWLSELPNLAGGETRCKDKNVSRKLLLFSGNDYMGLSFHPSLRKAAAKAAQEHGMGPRGSALVCGYTNYHQLLEKSLAELKMKEDCLLCPTGFAANLAFMSALGSISSLLSINGKPSQDARIAIFSDALNHASIIDGIRLVERLQEAKVFVYKHGDIGHLNTLLSGCKIEKKVVITDTLFSMDGDFAPIADLVNLRKKHNFLLAVDDAHSMLVCGKNGGGILEEYGCESDVDICIGTLSKAVGCQGGFIACSNKWKQLVQSRGRSFIFSTSLPVPVVAACHAALFVARKEKWRQIAIWNRVHEFNVLTQMNITSPIISLVIGSEKAALSASRHMLQSGFHITAIRPPTVPPNSCRLRITLSASHSFDDVKRLVSALSRWFSFPAVGDNAQIASKL
ncbi:8-amino-7-oxononanoate synthase-like isoform X1 [Zingiber officinale]|uniref:8-amino-7-oxononanoate synthase-like isoform X1 n=1 Tax=Zingiber officinale TaxID=94328 RepID=UPI001C4DCD83|nr:8-amino-7-oxononanoate synthase-like isoform X1 [Zingiber officinale]